MPKFVCDYGEVTSIAKAIKEEASNISSKTSAYDGNVKSDTKSWSGEAHMSYDAKSNEEIAATRASAEALNVLSEFLTDCVKSIQETDSNLASKKI
jgi:uncharacterized protein YukE